MSAYKNHPAKSGAASSSSDIVATASTFNLENQFLLICILLFYISWILFQVIVRRDMLGLRRLTSKLPSFLSGTEPSNNVSNKPPASPQIATKDSTSSDQHEKSKNKTTVSVSSSTSKLGLLRREKTMPVSNSASHDDESKITRCDSTPKLASRDASPQHTKCVKRKAPQPLRQSQSSSVLAAESEQQTTKKPPTKRKAPQPTLKQSQSSSALLSDAKPPAKSIPIFTGTTVTLAENKSQVEATPSGTHVLASPTSLSGDLAQVTPEVTSSAEIPVVMNKMENVEPQSLQVEISKNGKPTDPIKHTQTEKIEKEKSIDATKSVEPLNSNKKEIVESVTTNSMKIELKSMQSGTKINENSLKNQTRPKSMYEMSTKSMKEDGKLAVLKPEINGKSIDAINSTKADAKSTPINSETIEKSIDTTNSKQNKLKSIVIKPEMNGKSTKHAANDDLKSTAIKPEINGKSMDTMKSKDDETKPIKMESNIPEMSEKLLDTINSAENALQSTEVISEINEKSISDTSSMTVKPEINGKSNSTDVMSMVPEENRALISSTKSDSNSTAVEPVSAIECTSTCNATDTITIGECAKICSIVTSEVVINKLIESSLTEAKPVTVDHDCNVPTTVIDIENASKIVVTSEANCNVNSERASDDEQKLNNEPTNVSSSSKKSCTENITDAQENIVVNHIIVPQNFDDISNIKSIELKNDNDSPNKNSTSANESATSSSGTCVIESIVSKSEEKQQQQQEEGKNSASTIISCCELADQAMNSTTTANTDTNDDEKREVTNTANHSDFSHSTAAEINAAETEKKTEQGENIAHEIIDKDNPEKITANNNMKNILCEIPENRKNLKTENNGKNDEIDCPAVSCTIDTASQKIEIDSKCVSTNVTSDKTADIMPKLNNACPVENTRQDEIKTVVNGAESSEPADTKKSDTMNKQETKNTEITKKPDVKKPAAKLPTSVALGLAGPKSPSKTVAPQTFVPKVASEPIKIGFGVLKSRPKSEPLPPVKKKKVSRPKPPSDTTDKNKPGIFVQSQFTAEVISEASQPAGGAIKSNKISKSTSSSAKQAANSNADTQTEAKIEPVTSQSSLTSTIAKSDSNVNDQALTSPKLHEIQIVTDSIANNSAVPEKNHEKEIVENSAVINQNAIIPVTCEIENEVTDTPLDTTPKLIEKIPFEKLTNSTENTTDTKNENHSESKKAVIVNSLEREKTNTTIEDGCVATQIDRKLLETAATSEKQDSKQSDDATSGAVSEQEVPIIKADTAIEIPAAGESNTGNNVNQGGENIATPLVKSSSKDFVNEKLVTSESTLNVGMQINALTQEVAKNDDIVPSKEETKIEAKIDTPKEKPLNIPCKESISEVKILDSSKENQMNGDLHIPCKDEIKSEVKIVETHVKKQMNGDLLIIPSKDEIINEVKMIEIPEKKQMNGDLLIIPSKDEIINEVKLIEIPEKKQMNGDLLISSSTDEVENNVKVGDTPDKKKLTGEELLITPPQEVHEKQVSSEIKVAEMQQNSDNLLNSYKDKEMTIKSTVSTREIAAKFDANIKSDSRVKLAREKTPERVTHSTSEACISFRKSLENVRSLTSAVLEQSKSPSGGSKLRWLDKQRSPSSEVEDARPSPKDLASSRSSTSMYSARSSPLTPEFESEPAVFHPPPELAPFDTPPPQPRSNQGFGVVSANTGRKLDEDRYRTEVEVFFRAGALGQLESQRDERLQDHVTRLQARCRGYLARRRFAKRKVQEVAVQCIQRNVRRFLQVRDWPWWRLLVRVAPLLNVHRAEEELKTKTEELETLRARLEKVETERTRLKQDTDRLEARLSELSVALSEEHSAATLASERLEAETSERLRLQQELEHVQARHGELQQASERLEMELLFCRAADMNGSATLSSTTTEDEGDADGDGPGAAAVAHLRQRLERANRELALTKRRLTQQHEDDLEQMLALKKMLEKKIADAYEEVEEQRQVAAQWKRKAQRVTSEGNDSRLLLEEQAARNTLLEKRQRKFDAELQQLQEALRAEKSQRERATRERDLMAAEKSAVEQNLAACRLELEMRDEKVGSLSRELEELQFGGAAEEEVAALRKARHTLDLKLKEQEEELDDLAGQVSMLEQAKLRLEMSLEQARKEMRRELGQRDEELEEARCNAQKKVKALECQLEAEHEERTRLLREKHELERRLAEVSELARGRAPEDEQAIARLRRDLRHTKALLRDAHTMLEKYKSDAPGKGQIRQLRHQLEDAEFARTAALRAKQVAETELRETQASLEEVTRARAEAEERAAQAVRERTEARGQLEENEEEMAEVLRKYRAVVAQVSQEQAAMQEATAQMATLEAERNSLREQLAELAARVESAEGEHVSSLTQRRLEMRVRELESRLELEQTTRARLETQISRLKDSVEKLQAEGDAARAREAAAQDNSRRLQRQLREAREAEATQGTREADWARRRKELELRAEAAESEASTARTDLRLALQRVEDLQAAMAGELNSSASGSEDSEGESDSDESIESFLIQHKGSLRSTSHADTLDLDFSCRSPEGQSDPGDPASCTLSEEVANSKINESQA